MVRPLTFLTARTKVRRTLRDQEPLYRGAAGEARFIGALVDAVLELEEALAALGIHII